MAKKSANRDSQVVFRRINGRIVPVRVKRTGPDYANPDHVRHGVAVGTATGTSAYAAARAYRYKSFKQASRLGAIIGKLQSMREPMAPKMRRVKLNTGKYAKIAPDMFENVAFSKKMGVYKAWQARAAKLTKPRDFYRKAASMLGRHGGKAAIAVGVAVGIGAYLDKVAVDGKRK